MSPSADRDTALRLIRWFASPDPVDGRDLCTTPAIVALARANLVIRRLADLCRARDCALSAELAEAAAREAARVSQTIEEIDRIVRECRNQSVRCVLPKAGQHLPDMGNDIDLLVDAIGADSDYNLVSAIRAVPAKSSLFNRVAGKTCYTLPTEHALEIHHGRLGQVGEHVFFARGVLDRRVLQPLGPVEVWQPALEDQFLIQVVQRVFGHFTIRVSDILQTLRILKDDRFQCDVARARAVQSGVVSGMHIYLSTIGAICSESGVVAPARLRELTPETGRGPDFRGGLFGIRRDARLTRAFGALYAHAARVGDWSVVARLSAAPALLAWTVAARWAGRSQAS